MMGRSLAARINAAVPRPFPLCGKARKKQPVPAAIGGKDGLLVF